MLTHSSLSARTATLAVACSFAIAPTAFAAPPEYVIIDLGVLDAGDFGSQSFGVSAGGTTVVGRSIGVSNQAFAWTMGGGQVALPNFAGRPFGVANGANDAGVIVGTGSTTVFGSGPLPLIWDAGAVTQLPLPAGESLGRANDVNASGMAVGSVDGGSAEEAALYDSVGGTATRIIQTSPEGSVMTTAFGINDDGLVCGIGTFSPEPARNIGLVYDSGADSMVEVGALPGRNGAIAFGISSAGHVTGSSMQNQGSGTPFIWTEAGGIAEVPLPVGTSQGSGRGVNADGWVVGTASSAFAVPFLYDGDATYTIQELLPIDTPWDVSMNTSSSALGISDTGVIVGTGELAGQPRAYAMIPVAEPACPADLDGSGAVDFPDLTGLLASFGPCPGGGDPCPADFDRSGDVGFADLVALLAAWGPCPK